MLWAAPYLLAAVTHAAPASNYDEAACEEALSVQPVAAAGELEPGDCSEPELIPTVLDCNDPDLDRYLAGMIGSCDMPKPPSPAERPDAVRRGGSSGRRCDGFTCPDGGSTPAWAGSLDGHDRTPLLTARLTIVPPPSSSALAMRAEPTPAEPDRDPLERPPRG